MKSNPKWHFTYRKNFVRPKSEENFKKLGIRSKLIVKKRIKIKFKFFSEFKKINTTGYFCY